MFLTISVLYTAVGNCQQSLTIWNTKLYLIEHQTLRITAEQGMDQYWAPTGTSPIFERSTPHPQERVEGIG